MAQIEIKDLTFTYAGEKKPALQNISLEISKGEFVVICGKSGCGKSTLLRNLKPAICPVGERQGNIWVELWNHEGKKENADAAHEGNKIEETERKHIDAVSDLLQAKKIGFVMQNPDAQIVTDKVWHELAFGLENLGYKTEEIRLRVAEMAEYFDIVDWYEQSVDELSGGQKQLLNLAAVMAMHPEIMILDEPTAQLDPIAAENFLDTLKKINRDLGITIILSEHRLENVFPQADKVLVMEEGKGLCFDTPQGILKESMDGELLRLMPVAAQIYKESVDICQNNYDKENIPMSISEGRKWIDRLNLWGEMGEEKTSSKEEVITCKNLWFRYEKPGRDILRGLDLKVKRGEIFCILGGNGTGKSTTMSLLSGIARAYRGKIKIEGKVSALPQDVQTLFKKESVREELEGVSQEIINKMELDSLMEHHPYDISGGQQQKLALAKVLAQNPEILLLDEPTKGIDGIYKKELGEMLKSLTEENKTVVIVSHDVDFCGEYADRCGLFAQGSLIAVSAVRNFFAANRFYTTAVNKMAGHRILKAVKKEDVVCFLQKEDTISFQS